MILSEKLEEKTLQKLKYNLRRKKESMKAGENSKEV